MIDWLSDLRPKKSTENPFSTSSPKKLRNYSSWSGIVSKQLCWLALSYKSSSHGLNGGSENSKRMTGPGLGALARPYRILSHPNGWFFQPDFFFTLRNQRHIHHFKSPMAMLLMAWGLEKPPDVAIHHPWENPPPEASHGTLNAPWPSSSTMRWLFTVGSFVPRRKW